MEVTEGKEGKGKKNRGGEEAKTYHLLELEGLLQQVMIFVDYYYW